MAHLSLSVLGPLQIALDGQPAQGFAYNKARALLVYLAVEADRPQQRDALVGLLWPDLPDKAARTNLRQALANLRDAIGDAAASPPFLLISRDTVQFNRDSDYELDAAAFNALLAACRTHVHRHREGCLACGARLEQALALYRGEFLSQFALGDSAPFEEWTLVQREALHQRALEALEQQAAHYERYDNQAEARRAVAWAIELDPWREEAHQHLMRLLARAGQRSAALVQYETCRRILAEQLGVDPAAETTALYERIRTGTEGQASSSTVLRRALPMPPSALLGRATELQELVEHLSDPACRLITITGPGGVGKTRLALATAARLAGTFTHGAAFVSLAELSSADVVATAILAALNPQPIGQGEPKEQLVAYLRDRELLMVLDDFEHLLHEAGVTELLADLLRRAPGLTVLVTSRERLGLQAERVFDLDGLDYPADLSDAEVDRYSAVQLFVERARGADRRFVLQGGDQAAVARICRLMDGMPLGIELAAAGVRTRSCATIAAEFESGLHSLSSPWRDVPERHRSLLAAFEHSWRLLSPGERRTLRQLAVFRGGFTPAAAASVAAATPEALLALADKSLLRRVEPGDAAHQAQYGLHALVRQYVGEKLAEADELPKTQGRHAAYYLALVEEAEPQLTGSEQETWLDQLELAHDNVRAALRWAVDGGEMEIAARLSGALWRFWYIHGHVIEGRQWLTRVLADSVRTQLTPATQAKALNAGGLLAYRQGDFRQSEALLEQSLALYRQLEDQPNVATLLNNLGNVVGDRGDLDRCEDLLSQSLTAFEALRDNQGQTRALHNLAGTLAYKGDYPRARARYEQSLRLRREHGDQRGVAVTLYDLGNLARYEGQYAQARALLEESLAIFRGLADPGASATTLRSLADVARQLGEAEQARQLYGETLPQLEELDDKLEIVSGLAGVAAWLADQGQPEPAARLFGAAQSLGEAIGLRLPRADQSDYDGHLATAQAQLEATRFEQAWAEGQAMTPRQAVAYALRAGLSEPIET